MLDVYGWELSVQLHMAIVLVPIILSTWIRNLKYLVPVSSIANFLVLAGYMATMYIMSHDLPPISERRYIADWKNIPLFFGTVIYSFEGITLVSYIYNFPKMIQVLILQNLIQDRIVTLHLQIQFVQQLHSKYIYIIIKLPSTLKKCFY